MSTEPVLLFVDDEEILCLLFRLGLKKSGIDVITANSGEEALRIVEADVEKRIRVVFTDINMGAISGWELIDRCRALRNDLKFLVITAEPDNSNQGRELVRQGKILAYFDKSDANRKDLFDKCKEAMSG